MRNWHHKVIKIQEARNLLTSINNFGNSNIYIGVIEGLMEFSAINNNLPLKINNYKASHNSFSDILGTKKVFYRGKYLQKFSQEILDLKPIAHTTSVSGIISGNTDYVSLIDGINPKTRIINSLDFESSLFLGLINDYSNNNLRSQIYQSIFEIKFLNDGAFDPSDVHSNYYTSIISCSFRIETKERAVDFILKELFAYGRDGRGILVVCAAGNESIKITDNNNSSDYRSIVFSNKALIVAASKVLLKQNQLNVNSANNNVFVEEKADYSNYGERIDLCAPSGPDALPSKGDINIFAPTIINGGDIGADNQFSLVTISAKPSSDEIILSNVKGVFIGQSIELGDPTSYNHEVRFIKNVTSVPNSNDVKIKLDTPLNFTLNNSTTGNYNIINTQARLLTFKKQATRCIDSSGNISTNRLTLESIKGINATSVISQKVYIYHASLPLSGIETEIISVLNPNTSLIEIRASLNNLPSTIPVNDPLILIPDQISFIASYGNGYTPRGINDVIGFFVGQQVLVKTNGTSEERVGTITDIDSNFGNIGMKHCPGQNGSTYTIYSLAYGNFTSRFTGTSAATPIVSGLAGLVLSANNDLNALEIKHILKSTTDKITGASNYSLVTNTSKYNYGYTSNVYFGTGRVNAEAAVQLALDWHDPTKYGTTVFKPKLEIADKLNGTTIVSVPTSDPVDSPDIWVKLLSDTSNTLPTPAQPFNTINTSKKQNIHIRVRNTGNRESYKECDLRVFVAFTDDPTPAFSFPTMWYDQTDVKLLAVKEIPIIPFGNEAVIQIEWEDIAAKWNTWNPIVGTTGKRKRAYILAHIAPFDGLPTDVQPNDIRNNKQLTCKEIIVTHNGVSDRTAYLPGNNLNLTVGSEVVEKSFDFTMENILSTGITGFKIKATKMNNDTNHTIEEVFYKKTGNNWAFETVPSSNWIAFDSPTEIVGNHPDYINLKFPHTIKVNDNLVKVKLEIVNI